MGSGSVILKLSRNASSKSKTLSKCSRRSSGVLRIWPMRIRLNTISPKSLVEVMPQRFEHALRHVAVLLDGILPNRFAKLLTGQVPFVTRWLSFSLYVLLFALAGGTLHAQAQHLMGVVERFEDQHVRVELVARIFFQQPGNRM